METDLLRVAGARGHVHRHILSCGHTLPLRVTADAKRACRQCQEAPHA